MRALNQYQSVNRETSVIDADRHRLIQLLYDGALDRISMAKAQMQAKNIEGKNRLISKSIEILAGLREFLDMEQGGELAERLDALYEYMEMRLFQANIRNDMAALDEVSTLLKEIRSAWSDIRQQALDAGLV